MSEDLPNKDREVAPQLARGGRGGAETGLTWGLCLISRILLRQGASSLSL